MLKVKSLVIFIAATTLLFACKKDDTDGGNNNACRVNKINYYNSAGSSVDSAIYTYTGDKVTKVQLSSQNYTIEYSGNNISKKNYFMTAGANPDYYDQVTYNSDGTVSKVEYFERGSGANYTSIFKVELAYTSGKLTKLTAIDVTNNVSTPYEEYSYSYTGNNITTALYKDLVTGSAPETITYSYDNNPNLFQKQNKQALLIDPFFSDLDGFFLPMLFSANNVTSISGSGGSVPFSYELDNRQNLRDIKLLNQLFARYSYSC